MATQVTLPNREDRRTRFRLLLLALGGVLLLSVTLGVSLGPVSIPELLIDQLGLGLAKLLVAGQEYIAVTEIRVGDGTLTVRGAYQK